MYIILHVYVYIYNIYIYIYIYIMDHQNTFMIFMPDLVLFAIISRLDVCFYYSTSNSLIGIRNMY